MGENEARPGLPKPLRIYIALIAMIGIGFLAYLVQGVEWGPSTGGELGLFVFLIVVAGQVDPIIRTAVRLK